MDIISATKAFKSLCPMKQWGKKKKKNEAGRHIKVSFTG